MLGQSTSLPALENATKSWDNVSIQTFAYGEINFSGLGYFDGCNGTSCSKPVYQMDEKQGRARLITVQEVENTESGRCGLETGICQIWMFNYLDESEENGRTANDGTIIKNYKAHGYWTMNAGV